MSARRKLHADRNVSASLSPTTRLINQSPNQNRRLQNELHPAVETESEDEADLTFRTTSDTDGHNSIRQSDCSPTRSPTRPTPSPQVQRQQRPQKQPPTTKKETKQVEHTEGRNETCSNFNSKWILYAILLILPVIAYSKMSVKKSTEKHCDFKTLRQRGPKQSGDVWEALQINIELLLNKRTKSPNVYLFLHSKESNANNMQKLIHDIALETSKCFDGQRPVEMKLSDFKTEAGDDYGYPIEQYKKKLKEGNVFLIQSLNDIPSHAARALHTICDTVSPIEPDVVIFLTLRTHLSTAGGNPAQLAYQTLRELWSKVPDNELDALITRVIDQVLLLQV